MWLHFMGITISLCDLYNPNSLSHSLSTIIFLILLFNNVRICLLDNFLLVYLAVPCHLSYIYIVYFETNPSVVFLYIRWIILLSASYHDKIISIKNILTVQSSFKYFILLSYPFSYKTVSTDILFRAMSCRPVSEMPAVKMAWARDTCLRLPHLRKVLNYLRMDWQTCSYIYFVSQVYSFCSFHLRASTTLDSTVGCSYGFMWLVF